jgi:hypothetical protein
VFAGSAQPFQFAPFERPDGAEHVWAKPAEPIAIRVKTQRRSTVVISLP